MHPSQWATRFEGCSLGKTAVSSAMPRGRGSYPRAGSQSGRFAGRGYGRGGHQSGSLGSRDSTLVCFGSFTHACEGELVYKAIVPEQIPHFNAPVFLENKAQVGRVEEVFGPLGQVMFSVKPVPGVVAESLRPDDRVYITSDKLLPASYFLKKDQKSGGARTASNNRPRKPRGAFSVRGGRGRDRPFRGRGSNAGSRPREASFRSRNAGFTGGIAKRPPYRRYE
jgi:H/ACA ribonucleoprotein complex subunit 1